MRQAAFLDHILSSACRHATDCFVRRPPRGTDATLSGYGRGYAALRTSALHYAVGTLALVLTVCCGAAGCVRQSYDRIQIGQYREQYGDVLPESRTRETGLGLCYYDASSSGVDAIFVFLTHQRRVAGKLLAKSVNRDYGFTDEKGYRLEGEIDLKIAGFADTGPIDTLRAFIADMAGFSGERLAREASHWVAAGLIRLVQAAPGGVDVAKDYPDLADTLEGIPTGGVATLSVEGELMRFEYRAGSLR